MGKAARALQDDGSLVVSKALQLLLLLLPSAMRCTQPHFCCCCCNFCWVQLLLLQLASTCLVSVMSSCTSIVSGSPDSGLTTVLAWHSSQRGGLVPFTCCWYLQDSSSTRRHQQLNCLLATACNG